MTRGKKIEQCNYIKALIFMLIRKQGYFDYWIDRDVLFTNVALAINCSVHLVKRIFFKDIYINYKGFIQNFEY